MRRYTTMQNLSVQKLIWLTHYIADCPSRAYKQDYWYPETFEAIWLYMLWYLVIVFLLCDIMRKHGLCCRPVSIRLSVTLVYCIQMAEEIVKLLSRSGDPMILVFWSERWYPIPRGTDSVGAQNPWRAGKIGHYRLKSPFVSETVQNRPIIAMERS